ncbi:MAG: AsmA family protein [Pikeienuella sp.]
MRRFLKILAILVVILIVAIGAFIVFLPTDRIAQLAVDKVKAATGRDLTLAGGVSPSFYPVLGIETGAVTLSNAEWATTPNMVSTTSAKVGVELLPLLSGSVRITEIRLIDPVIALEVNEDGQANWVFDSANAQTAETTAPASGNDEQGGGFVKDLSLGETVIENGLVSFTDRTSGQAITLAEINAAIALPAFDQDMTVVGSALWNGEKTELDLKVSTPETIMAGGETSVSVSLSAAPVSAAFSGAVAPPQGGGLPEVAGTFEFAAAAPGAAVAWATGTPAPDGLLGLNDLNLSGEILMDTTALAAKAEGGITREGKRATVNLSAKSDGNWATTRAFDIDAKTTLDGLADASFAGNVAAPDGAAPSGQGTFTVKAPDLQGLAAFAGAALPEMGPGALQSLAVTGSLNLISPTQIAANITSLEFDAIRANGEISANLAGTPTITATLTTGDLDLRPYVTEGGNTTETPQAEPGWSKTPIDLSGLGALNGDFKIRAASVKAPNISLGQSDIAAKMSNGALTLSIRELGLYGGGLKGDIALDGRNNNAIRAKVTADAVRLLPMLTEIASMDMIEGLGAVNVNVTGGGQSLHDIMNSLNGNGGMTLTDGALVGYNLAAMVRNVQGAFGASAAEDAKTDFSEISATFDIAKGVMTNADFTFLGPLLRIAGEGTIDLGGQSLNFRLTPKAVTSLKGQGGSFDDKGIAFPLIIKGPWSGPSIRPDLKAGIDSLLKDPEGAVNAAKDLLKGVKGGGDGAGGALEAITGGNSGGLGGLLKGGSDDKAAPKDAVKGVIKGLFGSD